MKVAIVHDWIVTYAGSERVVAELLKIYPDADLYTSIYNPDMSVWFGGRIVYTTFLQRLWEKGISHQKLYPLMPMAFGMLDLSDYDLVISSSHAASKGIYIRRDSKHICYCHTPTRYLWSHQDEYMLQASNNKFKQFAIRAIIRRMREWDYDAAQRVDFFIANSNEVKNRINKFYNRSSIVIYPPVEMSVPTKSENLESNHYISVGRLVQYKRVDLAIQVCNLLQRKLFVIGNGEEYVNLRSIAGPTITFLGEVDEETKMILMSSAKALLFCGEEDFGIVNVEALLTGIPIIGYKGGGLLDILQDGINGLFFDNQTIDSLTETVLSFEDRRTDFNKDAIIASGKRYNREVFKNSIRTLVREATEV